MNAVFTLRINYKNLPLVLKIIVKFTCFPVALLMGPGLSLFPFWTMFSYFIYLFFLGLTRNEDYTPALIGAGNILDIVALMSA